MPLPPRQTDDLSRVYPASHPKHSLEIGTGTSPKPTRHKGVQKMDGCKYPHKHMHAHKALSPLHKVFRPL